MENCNDAIQSVLLRRLNVHNTVSRCGQTDCQINVMWCIKEKENKKKKGRKRKEKRSEASRSSGGNKLVIWSCPWCWTPQSNYTPHPHPTISLAHPFILSSSGPVALGASRYLLCVSPDGAQRWDTSRDISSPALTKMRISSGLCALGWLHGSSAGGEAKQLG